jgi:hypothetical protein
MVKQRFELEWDRPSLPGALTHVSLFDGRKDPQHIIASGHGRGDADALGDLVETLQERHAPSDAIAFAAEEHAALTGRPLARSRW